MRSGVLAALRSSRRWSKARVLADSHRDGRLLLLLLLAADALEAALDRPDDEDGDDDPNAEEGGRPGAEDRDCREDRLAPMRPSRDSICLLSRENKTLRNPSLPPRQKLKTWKLKVLPSPGLPKIFGALRWR